MALSTKVVVSIVGIIKRPSGYRCHRHWRAKMQVKSIIGVVSIVKIIVVIQHHHWW
jgi:hypothetical protein